MSGRRWLRLALSWVGTAGALWLAWNLADGEAALRRLAALDSVWLAAGLVVSFLQLLFSAARWRLTARRLGLRLERGRAVREYWLAGFLNQVVPGGVGGDLLRAWRHRDSDTAGEPALLPALRAVAIERLAGWLALLPCAAAGALLWLPPPAGPLFAAAALGGLLLLLAAPALARLLPRLPALGVLLTDMGRALLARDVLPVQLLLSAAILATYLLVFACAAAAVGVAMDPLFLLTGVPLVLLSMALPISVAGWGLREAAAAGLWGVAGAGAEAGLAASLAYGLIVLLASLPGAFVLLRRT